MVQNIKASFVGLQANAYRGEFDWSCNQLLSSKQTCISGISGLFADTETHVKKQLKNPNKILSISDIIDFFKAKTR